MPRWSVLVGVVLLSTVAAPAAAQEESAAPAESAAPGGSPVATQGEAPVNPYFETGAVPGSGEGKRIGYISLAESFPFVKLVSDSILEQGGIAGAEVILCDSKLDAGEALACAQNLGVQGVDGVLNFNAFTETSPEICAAYGNKPTISIDIHQECESSFMGANNHFAGEVAGTALGEALQAENGCTYDFLLTLESPQVGQVNTDRVAGMIDGFSSICGEVPAEKHQALDVGGSFDASLEQVTNVLPTIPTGGIVVILSLNDDMALGALGAARTAGREGELRIGAQGADPSAWPEIACNSEVWVADAAYFPERYGRTLIPAMIDLLDGKEIPTELFTPHQPVNAGNIYDLYPDAPPCDGAADGSAAPSEAPA
jgi:ribose transport system substrate-binding protein